MPPIAVRLPSVLPASEIALLRERLLQSGLAGESQLKGTFRGSRGFGVAFVAEARDRVRERFPALTPFLRLLDQGSPRRLLPWSRRAKVKPNAFYLNLLCVDDGHGVGRHVDGTLQDPAGVPMLTPDYVTVLYLQVPKRKAGGELVLYRGSIVAAVHEPVEGTLLNFRGHLAHEIRPLEEAQGPRVSLICEQYSLAPDVLARLAPITVQSRAPDKVFAAGPSPTRPFSDRLLLGQRPRSDAATPAKCESRSTGLSDTVSRAKP